MFIEVFILEIFSNGDSSADYLEIRGACNLLAKICFNYDSRMFNCLLIEHSKQVLRKQV